MNLDEIQADQDSFTHHFGVRKLCAEFATPGVVLWRAVSTAVNSLCSYHGCDAFGVREWMARIPSLCSSASMEELLMPFLLIYYGRGLIPGSLKD